MCKLNHQYEITTIYNFLSNLLNFNPTKMWVRGMKHFHQNTKSTILPMYFFNLELKYSAPKCLLFLLKVCHWNMAKHLPCTHATEAYGGYPIGYLMVVKKSTTPFLHGHHLTSLMPANPFNQVNTPKTGGERPKWKTGLC